VSSSLQVLIIGLSCLTQERCLQIRSGSKTKNVKNSNIVVQHFLSCYKKYTHSKKSILSLEF